MTKKAKEAILKWVASGEFNTEEIKELVDSYVALVHADVQERMATWQTGTCPPNCPDCSDDLDATEIG